MEFSITQTTEHNLHQYTLHDGAQTTSVSILPDHGALLHAFCIFHDGKWANVIDQYHDRETLDRELPLSFKSAKLSPFACRIPQGKYAFAGKTHELQNRFMDGSAIHGLLYNKPFVVTASQAGPSDAWVDLQYDYEYDDAGYPFAYRCAVRYTLHPHGLLQVASTLTNTGVDAMPVADGWHPYFTLSGKANDWLLQFHAASQVEFNQALIPTGRLLPFREFEEARLLGNAQLDHCFLLEETQGGPACRLSDPRLGLSIAFFPDATYPYLQIFTPDNRKSIAIENLSAAPDCFNNKMGLRLLHAGDSQTFTVFYQVSAL